MSELSSRSWTRCEPQRDSGVGTGLLRGQGDSSQGHVVSSAQKENIRQKFVEELRKEFADKDITFSIGRCPPDATQGWCGALRVEEPVGGHNTLAPLAWFQRRSPGLSCSN